MLHFDYIPLGLNINICCRFLMNFDVNRYVDREIRESATRIHQSRHNLYFLSAMRKGTIFNNMHHVEAMKILR